MKHSTINELAIAAPFTVLMSLVLLVFSAFTHGMIQDRAKDAMHDKCWRCSLYRFINWNNAAFEIREARRKREAAQ